MAAVPPEPWVRALITTTTTNNNTTGHIRINVTLKRVRATIAADEK
jgi:hypothetical protein